MKSLKIAVTALVIAGGTIAAFAFTKADNKSEISKQTTLHWFNQNATPGYIRSNTIPNEETASDGCEYPLTGCERGYSSSQLNNPANPSSGVKPSEVNKPTATLGRP